MTLASEQLVQSLVDILETNDTDVYVLDTNVVGVDFFYGEHNKVSLFCPRLARKNNIVKKEVRRHAQNVAMFLEMVRAHETLETTQQTIKELTERNRLFKDASAQYGERGKYRERHGKYDHKKYTQPFHKLSRKIESEKTMLREIMEKEVAILDILRTRVYAPEERKVQAFKELAMLAYDNCSRRIAEDK